MASSASFWVDKNRICRSLPGTFFPWGAQPRNWLAKDQEHVPGVLGPVRLCRWFGGPVSWENSPRVFTWGWRAWASEKTNHDTLFSTCHKCCRLRKAQHWKDPRFPNLLYKVLFGFAPKDSLCPTEVVHAALPQTSKEHFHDTIAFHGDP